MRAPHPHLRAPTFLNHRTSTSAPSSAHEILLPATFGLDGSLVPPEALPEGSILPTLAPTTVPVVAAPPPLPPLLPVTAAAAPTPAAPAPNSPWRPPPAPLPGTSLRLPSRPEPLAPTPNEPARVPSRRGPAVAIADGVDDVGAGSSSPLALRLRPLCDNAAAAGVLGKTDGTGMDGESCPGTLAGATPAAAALPLAACSGGSDAASIAASAVGEEAGWEEVPLTLPSPPSPSASSGMHVLHSSVSGVSGVVKPPLPLPTPSKDTLTLRSVRARLGALPSVRASPGVPATSDLHACIGGGGHCSMVAVIHTDRDV